MARAKNTERAEARRRYRAARAAQLGIAEEDVEALAAPATASSSEPDSGRRGFRFPDVRADIKALPGMFRTRRLLWLPVVLLFIGFGVYLAIGHALAAAAQGVAVDEGLLSIGVYYVQAVLLPNGLLVFVIAGFLAPRAPYLVGFLVGVLDATLLSLAVTLAPAPPANTAAGTVAAVANAQTIVELYVVAMVFGTFGGAFGAWYRNVFRKSQERSRARADARRRDQEAKALAERRDAKKQSRQPSRQGS